MIRGDIVDGAYEYSIHVPGDRPASDYTARIVPAGDVALIPLEAKQILWQK